MKDNKAKSKKKEAELDPANTDNFPPPEFVGKPAPGDTGYNLVAAAFNSQTDYFKPGIRSVNHEISKERNKKETPRRVYEHVHSFANFLILEGGNVNLEEILDWASKTDIANTANAKREIDKFTKSKNIKPEDLAKICEYLLRTELGYSGSSDKLDSDQTILIELIKVIDLTYAIYTNI